MIPSVGACTSKTPGKRRRGASGLRFPLILLIGSVCLMLSGFTGHQTLLAADSAQTDAANPRANFWRTVREGSIGVTTVQGQERDVLIQNGGENWRRIRNGLLASLSPWILAVVFCAIVLFFLVKGPDKLEEAPSGETILRWSLPDRLLHWYTAILFILMALTGLSMLFGRAVLIPVFGHEAFSGYLTAAMKIHNYGGPLFLAGLLIEIVAWFKHNIPKESISCGLKHWAG